MGDLQKSEGVLDIEKSLKSTNYHPNVSNPGAARQGNFINYYQFNPPSERLALLFPETILNQIQISIEDDCLICLDVGCNSGVSNHFSC